MALRSYNGTILSVGASGLAVNDDCCCPPDTRTFLNQVFTNGQTHTFTPTTYNQGYWFDHTGTRWFHDWSNEFLRFFGATAYPASFNVKVEFFKIRKVSGSMQFDLSMVRQGAPGSTTTQTGTSSGISSKWRSAASFTPGKPIDAANWTTTTGITLTTGETITWAKNGTDTDVTIVW